MNPGLGDESMQHQEVKKNPARHLTSHPSEVAVEIGFLNSHLRLFQQKNTLKTASVETHYVLAQASLPLGSETIPQM